MAACGMTARQDDCRAGCSAGWLTQLVNCPMVERNGVMAPPKHQPTCGATRYGCHEQILYWRQGHKSRCFPTIPAIVSPKPTPNGKPLKISHSSQFFGKIKHICPVVMIFFTKIKKNACQPPPVGVNTSSRRSGGIGRHARFRV